MRRNDEQSALSGKCEAARSIPTSRNGAPCDPYAVTAHYVYVLWHGSSWAVPCGKCGIARSVPTKRNSAPRDRYVVSA